MVPSTPFESSLAVYDWISGFINNERGYGARTRRSYRLDRMNILAEMAGRPETCGPVIHVAGSKGKGSVTGMIAAILEASGVKTAKYASPHAYDFRERLTLGNSFFDEGTYARAGNELKALVDAIPSSAEAGLFNPQNEAGEEPTFFELMTLWFFLCARESRSQAMAVETGLGGRLDATNIVDPLVTAITLIELEHTEFLGNTVAAIAGEKAGIMKPGRPLVLAGQSGEALEVFKEHASRKKCPLIYFPDCAEARDVRVTREGTSFSLLIKKGLSGEPASSGDLFVPMPGEVQAENAGLAVLAVKTAFPGIALNDIREGLKNFFLPARFERVSEKPAVIVDGAHTGRSVELCLKSFTELYGGGGILVFGCAAGKDLLSMARLCVPHFSRIIITAPGTFKKSNPEEIYAAFNEEGRKMNKAPEILFIPQTVDAADAALNLARWHDLPVLGTGSFYLAGEIRDRLRHP